MDLWVGFWVFRLCKSQFFFSQASCIAYPLEKIDTINQETGKLNDDSALSLIVYGESLKHLDLLEGLMEDLLKAKWEAFARKQWTISFAG